MLIALKAFLSSPIIMVYGINGAKLAAEINECVAADENVLPTCMICMPVHSP